MRLNATPATNSVFPSRAGLSNYTCPGSVGFMSAHDSTTIANAVAICMADPEAWRAQCGDSSILERSARTIVFNRGALAPMGPLIVASLVQVAGQHSAKMPAARVLSLWWEAVLDSCEAYAREPEGWTQEEVALFESSVARSFGVEDEMVHQLLRVFHGMDEGSRFGVLMMLEVSPSFSWLTPEIDSFTRDVGVEAPPKALRRLMRAVHGSS